MPRTADLVLLGGDVRTMDPAVPHAQAIAVDDGKIVALGTDFGTRPEGGEGAKR
ncbi:MAG: hypothetical protein SFX73_02095 [Kofleriaceae bacterium]|nr:hypothetical protein [Kofleriaceae bacterium]